ncbi:MAG: hypothetical protein JJT96_18795 [Opitutales bacterium]|nr:hypothetical protein [Opitutales bacterium]
MTKTNQPYSADSCAAAAVALLNTRFPNLEVGSHDAADYLDGFFGDDSVGFPYSSGLTVAWEQPGRLIALTAPQIHWWNPESLTFTSSASEEAGIALLFLHEDGHTYHVDDFDGVLHPLFPTPPAEELALYLQLFFQEGRDDLVRRDAIAPRIERICLPLPRSTAEDPTAPSNDHLVDLVEARAMVATHLRLDEAWMACDELHRLSTEETTEEATPSTEASGEESIPLEDFIRRAVANRKLHRSLQRPAVHRWAGALAEDDMCPRPPPLRSIERAIPYTRFEEKSVREHRLPLVYLLSEGVFAPALSNDVNPAAWEHLVMTAQATYFGLEEHPAVQNLPLPPFSQQVSSCFLHAALLQNGPLLAARALRAINAPERSANTLQSLLLHRIRVLEGLQTLARTAQL